MGSPTDLPTSATLQLTPELISGLDREARALTDVQDYVIDSPEMAVAVNGQLQDIKRRQKVVAEWDERFAQPIRQLETTRTAFFGPAKKALAEAEAFCKRALQGWQALEVKRIADERRAADEAARRAREQAERDAAAARARAEAAAAEAQRKAAEAAERERKAQESGDARAAAAAAAERARCEETERQKREEGERKAQELQLAAAATVQPTVTTEQTKLAGFSTRKNWIAELEHGKTKLDAKLAIVNAIAKEGRADLLSLLAFDMKAANKLAKALEDNFRVPCLKSRNDPIAASKG